MFPKAIGSHRGAPGTITPFVGQYGSVQESYTGNVLPSSVFSITNPDAADVLQYQYWNGSSWVDTTYAGLSSLAYAVGFKWRVRLVNSYFGTTGSYYESSAGTTEDTGGATALQAALPTFNVFNHAAPDATSGSTHFLVSLTDVPLAYIASRNIYNNLRIRVTVSWAQTGGGVTQDSIQYTFNLWPVATAGWVNTPGIPRVGVTYVDISGMYVQLYVAVTFAPGYTWTSTVTTAVQFEALYPDSNPVDPATYGYKEVQY